VVDLGGGVTSTVWTYNGQFPGPTFQARAPEFVSIELTNGLADETITHWHGMIVDDVNDGHPRFAVPNGGSYSYNFTIEDRARLNWYHPHPHGRTGEQVAMGLAGAFIIRDDSDDVVMAAVKDREIPLIIRDARLDKNGDMQYQAKRGGFEGNTPLVNGTLEAGYDAEPAVYRLRILNGSNARIYRLALDNGDPFTLIGNDGGFLGSAVSISEITLAPAERLDVLVDLRGQQGNKVMLQDLNAGWDLLEFAVSGGTDAGSTDVSLPSLGVPLSGPVTTREFSFDGMSRINGQLFEMDRIDFDVPADTVERWVFTTNGNAPHPVHVHLDPFQIQSRTGGRGQVFPWEEGWKDTVLLEDGETVEILVRFSADPGTAGDGIYLMHCHKLEHEDMGMMLNFRVVPG
jgi:FtsP/CotA-like multicopper oxidase with cupredoxin domain